MKSSIFRLSVAIVALSLCACGGSQARKTRHLAKGQVYLAEGNLEKARVEFQNALQIAPLDSEARYENGVVDEKLGKPREAARYYQAAIDVNTDHLGARSKLARLYLVGGGPDKALELIKPALDQHPNDSQLLTLRAAAEVQQKDVADGQRDAERAVQLDPMNEDAVSALAGIYVSTKAPEKAQSLLEETLKRVPGSVDARLTLAQVYAAQGRPADTERLLLEIVRLRPAEKAHRIRLAQFYMVQSKIDQAESALRDGIAAIPGDRDLKFVLVDFLAARRSSAAAQKELQDMVSRDPTDVEMKLALGKFYVADNQPERAEAVYREMIARENLDAAGIAARDRLAALRAQQSDVKGADELIAQVLGKSPRDTDALTLRGTLELAKSDPKAAIADLRTVLRDQPNATGVLRMLARAHLANGEAAIAEETMRRALESSPKDPSLRLDLAQLLAQMGKPEQATPVLLELVKDQPNDVEALDTLFRVSASVKDYDEASSAAEAIVAIQPKRAVGYLYEGMLAEQSKRNDDAIRLYSRAVDLEPDVAEPLEALTRLLVVSKHVPQALARLDEIIEKNPKNAQAPSLKGELFLTQNNTGAARDAYQLAIERAPRWWVPYRGLAMTQLAEKNPDAAIATLQSAVPKVDEPERLELEAAGFLERNGKIQEAMRTYESVILRNPRSEVAANNLAMLLVTYGKDGPSLDRAKSIAARFANSTNPSYLDTYGWVLFKHGEAAASVPVFERVVSKVPDAPVARYHLGMAESESGDRQKAFADLTRALSSGTQFSGIDEAKATLNKLAKLSSESAPRT